MTLTTLLLSEWFAKFNHLYFCDTLPTPLFRLSKARTRFGYMKCVTSRKSWFSKPQRTFTIYISTYYDCSERDYQTVLLHEMIHYLICFLRLEDTSPHGVLFKKKADQINRCGWNITVSTNASHLKVSEQTRKRQRGRCLLLLVTTDKGQRFLSAVAQPGEVAARKARQERRGASVFSEHHAARRQERAVQRQLLPIASSARPTAKSRNCEEQPPIILSPQERRQDFLYPSQQKVFQKGLNLNIFF